MLLFFVSQCVLAVTKIPKILRPLPRISIQKTDSESEKAGSGDNTATSDDTEEEFVPMSIPSRKSAYKLSNTYSKIKNEETVKVVYYGGSVTNGNGASDDEKTSYRALTTAYLKTLSSKVIETNLCIGGTGTYLAAVVVGS